MRKYIIFQKKLRYLYSAVFFPGLFLLIVLLTVCGNREEKDIINYISDLGKRDFLLRMGAAKLLSEQAREVDIIAVPYLILALQDPRIEIRRYSARALGRIRDYSSIPDLIAALGQDTDEVRYDCILALGGFEDTRVNEAILSTLNDDNPFIRWASAEVLGKLKDEKAYSKLVAGLKDENSYVRCASAKALGLLGNKHAIPYLRNSIYNSNLWVRNAAALALSRLGNKDGIPVLIMNLESKARDKKGSVSEQAAAFLREISGKNFGFNASDPPEKKKASILRWKSWWEKYKT